MKEKSLSSSTHKSVISARFLPTANLNLSVITASIITEALANCSQKMHLRGKEEVLKGLIKSDDFISGSFRYYIAKQVAEYLGEVEAGVKAVYYLEEQDEPVQTRLICLIVQVERKTAALASLMEGLNQSLVEEYKKLMAPNSSQLKYLLSVIFLDSVEAESKTGEAAILSSCFNPPMRIWAK